MKQQRVIGSVIIILGGLVMLPFLGIQKCNFEQNTNEVAMIERELLKQKVYQIKEKHFAAFEMMDEEEMRSFFKQPKSKKESMMIFAIQLAIYDNIKYCDNFLKVLKQKKLNPIVQKVQTSKGMQYKILIEGKSLEQLQALQVNLKKEFHIDPIIVQFMAKN